MPSPTFEQLKLVALAARFVPLPTPWDPEIDILCQLGHVVTCAEYLRGIDPTRQPLTEGILKARLEHLDIIAARVALQQLDVESTEPLFDHQLLVQSLVNLRVYSDYKRTGLPTQSVRFDRQYKESDMILVGTWMAAQMCSKLGYAFPNLEKHPLHSIINSLVNLIQRPPPAQTSALPQNGLDLTRRTSLSQIHAPLPTRGQNGFGYPSLTSAQGPAVWELRIPRPPPPSSSSANSSRAASPVDGRTATPALATRRCPSPPTGHTAKALASPQTVEEAGQETDGLWEMVPMEH